MEPKPIYIAKSSNGSSYPTTKMEQRLLRLFEELRAKAITNGTPQILTVFVTDTTVSFFNGNPSGIERVDR